MTLHTPQIARVIKNTRHLKILNIYKNKHTVIILNI